MMEIQKRRDVLQKLLDDVRQSAPLTAWYGALTCEIVDDKVKVIGNCGGLFPSKLASVTGLDNWNDLLEVLEWADLGDQQICNHFNIKAEFSAKPENWPQK